MKIRPAVALALLLSAALAAETSPQIALRDGLFLARPSAVAATLEVFVDGPVGLPPLLGTTSRDNDAVVFRPRFPLQPGLRYRAVYRTGAEAAPLIQLFSLPAEVARPLTRVERIDPTGDALPENLLKLYVHFSAPMSRGEAYRRIRLLDDRGQRVELPFLEIDQELWDRDARRLTLLFDPGRVKRDLVPHEAMGTPLRAGRVYTLVVEGDWPDAHGNALYGETRKTFRVGPADYDPPRISDWRIAPPRAGTRDALSVTFPDPLDRALLDRVLEVVAPSGGPVPGAAAVDSNEMRWRFTPSDPWNAGDYALRALAILEDLAGNSLARRFEVDVFERIEDRGPRVWESVKFRIK